MLIAIDGPAGAGKSTVARAVAEALGATYLDSGAMYRCVALATSRAGVDPSDADRVAELAAGLEIELGPGFVGLGGESVEGLIRAPEVTEMASRVSVHPGVREALVARQRELTSAGLWIAEGRDIGTVVAPDAPLKVFLTAGPEERARRRSAENGEDEAAVLAAITERDRRDSERDHGALRPADDAVPIDTTGVEVDHVVAEIVELARQRGLGE